MSWQMPTNHQTHFGAGRKPFGQHDTKVAVSAQISSEDLGVQTTLQGEVHVAEQHLDQVISVSQIHDVIKHVDHSPAFDYKKTSWIATQRAKKCKIASSQGFRDFVW